MARAGEPANLAGFVTTSRLTPVEAFRAQVLVEEALRKLAFLGVIAAPAGATNTKGGDELSEFIGDEINRIINEQRELEKRYEELVAERSKLKGLTNKSRFREVQQRIQEVARGLRESNKTLCRNLRETPNIKDNLDKFVQLRLEATNWYEDLRNELQELTFTSLQNKVIDAQNKLGELAQAKLRLEKETAAVKHLEQQLAKEHADHEKETKQDNQEIVTLKEDLQRSRITNSIKLSFEEKQLRAKESALLRIFAQSEKTLEETLAKVQTTKDTETLAHNRAADWLQVKTQNLQDEKQRWEDTFAKDTQAKDDQKFATSEKLGRTMRERHLLDERMAQDRRDYESKLAEAQRVSNLQRFQEEQIMDMQQAVFFLQEAGREYMNRRRLREAANKKKKKKGGKKKKK
eukprot:GDKI01047053.1.p1 GENE.GDKI01047053.1~~GDKI01047053.1.p1  ORF type:complete len:405 (+),score=101.50 GDKI01047053.1:76-1290(+)